MGCAPSSAAPVGARPKQPLRGGGASDAADADAGAREGGVEPLSASSSVSAEPAPPSASASAGARGGGASTDTFVASALRSKRARGAVILGDSHLPDEEREAASRRRGAKPPDVRAMLRRALLSNVLFGAYGSAELSSLVDALEPCACAAGDVVIRQGAVGDALYVIEAGRFEIIKDGVKVADWGDGTANRTFGELALMYDCPRAATVRCSGGSSGGCGGGVLWRVDRRTFRGVVAHAAREQHAKLKRALRRGLLEGLTEQQLDRVADAATVVRFGPGEQVIRKGEAGEVFFIIDEGAVLCRNLGGDQADNLLQAGDYFGERALLTSELRAADVFAEGPAGCTLVALHRDDFTSLLGHLRELLEHNVGMRLLLCMPVLAALSDDDRTALFGSLRVASFASGAAILPAGSVPSEFYIVKEGTVRVVAGGAPTAGAAAGDGGDGVGSGGRGGGGGGDGESTPLLVPPPPGGGSPSHVRGSGQQPVALLQPGHFFAPRELAALEPVACSYVAEAAPAVPASAAIAATPAGGDTVDPSATRPLHAPVAAAVQCFVTDRATYMRLLAPYVAAPASEAPPAAPAASAATRSRAGSSSSSSHGSSRPASAAASSPPGEPTSARPQQPQPGHPRHDTAATRTASGGSGDAAASSLQPSAHPSGGRGRSSSGGAAAPPNDARGQQSSNSQPLQPQDGCNHRPHHQPDFRLARSDPLPGSGGGVQPQPQPQSHAGEGATSAPPPASSGGGGAHQHPSASSSVSAADAASAAVAPPGGRGGGGHHAQRGERAARRRLGLPFRELEQRATVGTGTFGRVRLVLHRESNRAFALKMLQKAQVVALKQQANILNERALLWRVDHPFIIKLFDTYRDRDRLYMLLELVQGGELFSRLQADSSGRVSVAEARFYAACVLDALEYMHSLDILYRDLKPENLLIDSDGYLKLVDFGFAKVVHDKTYTLCGTPEYLAPELVLGRGHDKGVDYWALGVLLYEMVCGCSPFADQQGNDQMVICRNILRGEFEFPAHVKDKDLRDLVARLLVKDVTKRLGCMRGGARDVKAHRFFRGLDWGALARRELPAPWQPALRGALDTSHFDEYDEQDNVAPYTKATADDWDRDF